MDPLIIILSSFCLASAFITFGLGIAVYSRDSRSRANRLFLLAMLSATYWAFCEYMIWQAGTPDGVWFWLKASSLWPFVVAFTIHFVLVFTSPPAFQKYNSWLPVLIYLPAGLISLILLFTSWIFTIGPLPGSGYTYLPLRDSPAYQIESLYILLMMLFGVGMIISFWKHAATGKVKAQALMVCAAISTVIFFGFLSGILLPAFGIFTPNLVFIGIVLFSVIITFAIQKYELFVLSPITVVPDILRTMPDAMILADIGGTIISTNESAGRIFDLDEKNLPGKTLATCIPEKAVADIRGAVLEQGTVNDLEITVPGTGTRTVSIAASLVEDNEGEPAGIVLIVRDITDRKTAEKALRIASEKISLLTRTTRHDINNLVSALSGYLLLLKENPGDPESGVYVTASMEIAERIHSQLQFTREYQDIGSGLPTWQPLGQILFRIISGLSHDKVKIISNISEIEIHTDPLIVKVLYNILENAIRHGEHITLIRISTEPNADKSLHIIVEDDGVGISECEKEKIFQYGYGKNSGLGLALSRDILSLTGITITENGVPGAGARFVLLVPETAWRSMKS